MSNVISDIKLSSYPEGLIEVSNTLDFLAEEERFGFMMGWIVAALMED